MKQEAIKLILENTQILTFKLKDFCFLFLNPALSWSVPSASGTTASLSEKTLENLLEAVLSILGNTLCVSILDSPTTSWFPSLNCADDSDTQKTVQKIFKQS